MIWLALACVLGQLSGFSYSDLGLESAVAAVAQRYPGSTRVGDHLYIAPGEVRDFVTGITLTGAGEARRLRISFESTQAHGRPRYPRCSDIQRDLEREYGPPNSVRAFSEEASRRSDRIWRTTREEMTLVCFEPPRGRESMFAEAIVIVPRQ